MPNNTEIWIQANEIFTQVSELTAKDAIKYIDKITNIDANVKAAVISLINVGGSQAAEYFKDKVTPHFAKKIQKEFSVGQVLDEYELIEELGHGGMSQVFMAKRLNVETQTHVAIKIFAPRESHKDLLQHFLNEQKILAELSHAHIIKMYHGGNTEDNITYLVMELVEDAQDIKTFAQNNQLNNKAKMKLICQCADALVYSHANLIIHRDLKPDNILINRNKELKIVDFGIAKLLTNDISGNTTTILALTPSFAAPEQINSEIISVKTDIFSLAVVALSLLTDKAPLPDDRLIKSCATDEQHLETVIKSLKCDKDLKNILTKALAHDPKQRYANMQSFMDDLDNWLAAKPVNATSPSFFYRVKKFAQRRAALFASLISLLVFLLIGSIAGYQQYKLIKIEAMKAKKLKHFMIDTIDLIDPNSKQGINIRAIDIMHLATQELSKTKDLEPEVRFDFSQTVARSYGKLGQYKEALEMLEKTLKIHPNDSISLSYKAQYLYNIGQNKELAELLNNTSVDGFDSPIDSARFLRTKAAYLSKHKDIEQAFVILNQVIKKNKKINNPAEKIQNDRLWAEFKLLQSKPQEAIDRLSSSLEQSKFKANHTLILALRSDLATLYDEVGSFDLALKERKEIEIQYRKILGENHPKLAKALLDLSVTYRRIGEMSKSQEKLDSALEISLLQFGKNNLLTADILSTSAVQLLTQGKPLAAIEKMKEVEQIYKKLNQADSEDAITIKINIATIYNRLAKNQESYAIIKDLYEHLKVRLGESNISTLASQTLLSSVLADLGKTKEAIELAELAVKNAQKPMENSSNHILAGTYFRLAKNYQQDKQLEKARETFLELFHKNIVDERGIEYAVLTSSIAGIYQKTNDFEESEKYYKISLKSRKKLFESDNPQIILVQIRYATLLKKFNKTKQYTELVQTLNETVQQNKIKNEQIINALKTLNGS